MNYFLKYKKYIFVALISIIILILGIIFYPKESQTFNNLELISVSSNLNYNNEDSFYIDIKGAVNKPGVYKFNLSDKVIDAISLAGGLKKNATTTNINLSKALTSEMVIYVYTKYELNHENNVSSIIPQSIICDCESVTITDCFSSSINEESQLVNINTASIDELMTLTGIGNVKATAIINYREITKFTKIEDILNVSGFGQSLFDKIKNNITV